MTFSYICDHCCTTVDAVWYPMNNEGICPSCAEDKESEEKAGKRMATHLQWLDNFKPEES